MAGLPETTRLQRLKERVYPAVQSQLAYFRSKIESISLRYREPPAQAAHIDKEELSLLEDLCSKLEIQLDSCRAKLQRAEDLTIKRQALVDHSHEVVRELKLQAEALEKSRDSLIFKLSDDSETLEREAGLLRIAEVRLKMSRKTLYDLLVQKEQLLAAKADAVSSTRINLRKKLPSLPADVDSARLRHETTLADAALERALNTLAREQQSLLKLNTLISSKEVERQKGQTDISVCNQRLKLIETNLKNINASLRLAQHSLAQSRANLNEILCG